MTNFIINFFQGLGAILEPLKSESSINYNIYYFKYINYSNINKLNQIIKSFRGLFSSRDIKTNFDNFILKIEIEKEKKQIILFENYFQRIPKNQHNIFMGLSNENELIFYPLQDIKSLLIGGSSGSGKSNLLHNIILSSLLLNNDIYYFMIDLKATELTRYNDILKNSNRLIKPIATNQKQAIKIIIEFYYIIKNRFERMQRNKERQSNESPIILIIDEYAQLFDNNKQKNLVNNYISKIGAIGRACNCYLILATQHPTNANISNTIRANLQSKCALKCDNVAQARNILNETGAEKITRPGARYIHIDGDTKKFVNVPFISDNLLTRIEQVNNQ